VKAILRRFKRLCTVSGGILPKRSLRGLEGLLAKRKQTEKYLLRLRIYLLRLRRLLVK